MSRRLVPPPRPVPEWVGSAEDRLILASLYDLEVAVAVTQEQLNQYATAVAAYTQAVNTGVAGLAADIRNLKAANPDLDASALEAHLAALGRATQALVDLDSENPPTEPAPLPPGPTP